MGEGVEAMKKNRSQATLPKVLFTLMILMGVVLCASPALAEELSVSGADHIYSIEQEDDAVDVLTITGPQNATVYINMYKNGEVLASHLAFTLDEYSSQADEDGNMVGVASVEFTAEAFSNDEVYSIEVYADREQTELLYKGVISTVFASYGDDVEALAVRTLAKGEKRPLPVPQTRDYRGVSYELVSDEPTDKDGLVCYEYEQTNDMPESVDAHVSYYDVTDPTGDPIKTDTITLAQNSSQDVAIQEIIATDDGSAMYRTLQLSNKVTVAYPGTTEYAIMCKRLGQDGNGIGTFYKAIIQYTDAEGNDLGIQDSVIVNKSYTYTAPSVLYVKEGDAVKEYQIQNREDAVLRFAPGDAEGEMTYQVAYEPVEDKAKRTWTVVLENGSVAPLDADRVLDRITYKGKPGKEVTHVTEQRLTIGDNVYVPVTSAQESYTHTFSAASMGVEQVIYYVPEGYVAPEPYEVSVKYINIATNETIDTATYTASPSMRSDLEIETPESFSKGGVEWIRLAGQDEALRHSFYSGAREYAIYYRDANDNLHKDTIIRTVRVVYIDDEGNTVSRPKPTTDNGSKDQGSSKGGTAAGNGGANGGSDNGGGTAQNNGAANGGNGAASNDGASAANEGTASGSGAPANDGAFAGQAEQVVQESPVEDGVVINDGQQTMEQADGATGDETPTANDTASTGLQTGTDILSISGEGGNTLVSQDGTDLATMRIEDDETPLAGPGASDATGAASTVSSNTMAIGAGASAAAAAGIALFLVFKRRQQKQGAGDSSTDEPLA
jgi:hypothetical protein